MNKIEILDRFKEDLWQSSPHTVSDRTYYAGKFLTFVAGKPPEEWSRSVVIAFMRQLIKEGFAVGTQRKISQITKRVFDAAGQPWPMGKRGMPKMQPSDMVRPATEVGQVKQMVEAARDGRLASDEVAMLALATTYGLRREELARVRPEHIDYSLGRIYVMTCKGGIERWHLLAPEIVPFLQTHDFSRVYSPFCMSKIYLEIEKKTGIEHTDGAGWHALRRQLDTCLVQWNYLYAKIFLRWKLGGDMALYYVTLDPLSVDKIVFEHHPFLKFW